jgi:flagellar hook-associated protein 1
MGMGSVLNSALSGLRATQAGLELVSRNVANADIPGYTKKSLGQSAIVSGDSIIGIRMGDVTRQLDTLVQRQMWRELSGSGYIDTRARYHSHLDTLFGAPGSPAAIDSLFNGFRSSLEKLTTSPDDFTVRDQVLRDAQAMAQMLNQSSADIQSMRLEAEKGISDAVRRVNELLVQISKLNRDIASGASSGRPPADLMDIRDRHVGELSKMIDLKVVERDNGEVALFTQSGALLLDLEPVTLEFDERGMMTPESLYDRNEADRGVGTIRVKNPNGLVIDLIEDRSIRSGELAALIEMRDKTLVEAQEQLDALAASLSRSLSTNDIAEPVDLAGRIGADVDLSAMLSGDRMTITYVVDGVEDTVTIVRVNDSDTLPLAEADVPGAEGRVVGLNFTDGWASIVTQLSAELGAGIDIEHLGDGVVRFLDDGPPATISDGVDYGVDGSLVDLSAPPGGVLTVTIDGTDHDFNFGVGQTGEDLIVFLQAIPGLSAEIDDDGDLVIEGVPGGPGFTVSFNDPDVGVATGLSEGDHGRSEITALSARATATGFHDGIGLPFFIDGGNGGIPFSGSLDGRPQQVGFSGRIRVNPALFEDNTRLVRYAEDTPIGDSARPQEILRRLTQEKQYFPGTLGVSGSTSFTGTVAGFVQRIVSYQGAQAADVARNKDAQDVVVAQLEERFTRQSGVNIDEEMARLIELQTAYQANSRVVQAYREMISMLLQL